MANKNNNPTGGKKGSQKPAVQAAPPKPATPALIPKPQPASAPVAKPASSFTNYYPSLTNKNDPNTMIGVGGKAITPVSGSSTTFGMQDFNKYTRNLLSEADFWNLYKNANDQRVLGGQPGYQLGPDLQQKYNAFAKANGPGVLDNPLDNYNRAVVQQISDDTAKYQTNETVPANYQPQDTQSNPNPLQINNINSYLAGTNKKDLRIGEAMKYAGGTIGSQEAKALSKATGKSLDNIIGKALKKNVNVDNSLVKQANKAYMGSREYRMNQLVDSAIPGFSAKNDVGSRWRSAKPGKGNSLASFDGYGNPIYSPKSSRVSGAVKSGQTNTSLNNLSPYNDLTISQGSTSNSNPLGSSSSGSQATTNTNSSPVNTTTTAQANSPDPTLPGIGSEVGSFATNWKSNKGKFKGLFNKYGYNAFNSAVKNGLGIGVNAGANNP